MAVAKARKLSIVAHCVGDQAGLPSCRQRGLQVAAGDQLQGMQLLAAILSAWPVILTGHIPSVLDGQLAGLLDIHGLDLQ
jgi:hypothetical protein